LSTFPRRVWVFLASCGWPTASAANRRIVSAPAMTRTKAWREARLIIETLLKFIVTQPNRPPMRPYAHVWHGMRPGVDPGRTRLVPRPANPFKPRSQLAHDRAVDGYQG